MTKAKDEKYTSLGCLSQNINKGRKKGSLRQQSGETELFELQLYSSMASM